MIRYKPKALFTIECLNRQTRFKLTRDSSHMHYFLEELYGAFRVRSQNYSQCKKLLRKILSDETKLIKLSSSLNDSEMLSISVHDIIGNQHENIQVPVDYSDSVALGFCWYKKREVFISGLEECRKGCIVVSMKCRSTAKKASMH